MADFLLSLASTIIFASFCLVMIFATDWVTKLTKFSSSSAKSIGLMKIVLKALGVFGLAFIIYSFVTTWIVK